MFRRRFLQILLSTPIGIFFFGKRTTPKTDEINVGDRVIINITRKKRKEGRPFSYSLNDDSDNYDLVQIIEEAIVVYKYNAIREYINQETRTDTNYQVKTVKDWDKEGFFSYSCFGHELTKIG